MLEVRLEVLKDISKELLEYENIFIDKVAEDEKALEGGLERTPEEEKAYEEERGEDLKTLLKLQMDELNAAALFAITGSYLVSLDNEADELDEEILNDSLRRKDLCLHKKLSWHLDNLDDSVYSFKENLAADVHALLLKLDFSYRVVDALDDRFEANMANFPLKTELKDIELEKEFLTEVTDYEDIDVVEFAEEAYVFIAGKNTRTGEVYKQEDSTEKFNGKVMDVTHLYSSPRLLHFLRWVNVKVEEAPQQEE